MRGAAANAVVNSTGTKNKHVFMNASFLLQHRVFYFTTRVMPIMKSKTPRGHRGAAVSAVTDCLGTDSRTLGFQGGRRSPASGAPGAFGGGVRATTKHLCSNRDFKS